MICKLCDKPAVEIVIEEDEYNMEIERPEYLRDLEQDCECGDDDNHQHFVSYCSIACLAIACELRHAKSHKD